MMECWQCGCETLIITGVNLRIGTAEWRLRVGDFDPFPELFETVRSEIPPDLGIGPIKSRYSRTMGRAYLSNGCAHCDALLGGHHEHYAWHDQRTVRTFALAVSEQWRRAVAKAVGEEPKA